jgi:hypothetical protein
VFGGGTFQSSIVVHLDDCRADNGEMEEHPLHLVKVLGHHLCQFIVHETTDTVGLLDNLAVWITDDLCADRTSSREKFLRCLGLELNCGLDD